MLSFLLAMGLYKLRIFSIKEVNRNGVLENIMMILTKLRKKRTMIISEQILLTI